MSTFNLPVLNIATVEPHPNADRLDIVTVEGIAGQVIAARDSVRIGEKVVYFPVDTVLPPHLIDFMGLTGKLAGKDKNRVKTIKLRGQISQGIVFPLARLEEFCPGLATVADDDERARLLGVTKYEVPEPEYLSALHPEYLQPLPYSVSKYDIEGAQRFMHVVADLLDKPVVITEKLEGAHWAATIFANGSIIVSQRNYAIDPNVIAHPYYQVLRRQRLDFFLRELLEIARANALAVDTITIRGEFIGKRVQGNIYGLLDNEVRLFEVEINGQPVGAVETFKLFDNFAVPHVPVLWNGGTLGQWLDGRALLHASNGRSRLGDTLREGVVIRPAYEMYEKSIGRVILKMRSPEYLAGADT